MSDNSNNTLFKASSKISDGNTEIKWNSPICAFVVERRTIDDGDGQWQAIGHVPADRDSFSMGESSENCKFEYRVVAKMSSEITLASQPTGISSLAENSQAQISNRRQTRSSAKSSIIAQTRPGQPRGPLASEWISPRSFKLSWNPPSNDGGSPITSYIVERADETGDTWSQLKEVHASRSTTSLILTSYHFEQFGIVAVNACGRSEPLRTEMLRPLPPLAPEVEMDPSNENYIELKWTFPTDRLVSQHVKFKHFYIGRRVGNGKNFVKICNDVKGNSYRDADVTGGQWYQYEVTTVDSFGTLNCTRTDPVAFQAAKMKKAKRRREKLRRRLKREMKDSVAFYCWLLKGREKMAIQEDSMQSINQADEPGLSGVKQEFQEQQETPDMKQEAVDSEVTPDMKVIKMEIDLE